MFDFFIVQNFLFHFQFVSIESSSYSSFYASSSDRSAGSDLEDEAGWDVGEQAQKQNPNLAALRRLAAGTTATPAHTAQTLAIDFEDEMDAELNARMDQTAQGGAQVPVAPVAQQAPADKPATQYYDDDYFDTDEEDGDASRPNKTQGTYSSSSSINQLLTWIFQGTRRVRPRRSGPCWQTRSCCTTRPPTTRMRSGRRTSGDSIEARRCTAGMQCWRSLHCGRWQQGCSKRRAQQRRRIELPRVHDDVVHRLPAVRPDVATMGHVFMHALQARSVCWAVPRHVCAQLRRCQGRDNDISRQGPQEQGELEVITSHGPCSYTTAIRSVHWR